ncbi:GCN5 family acetyltransferase [Brachionus plicatilis]|uniref:GCN5 family acetyltransferase n=1 Tax=Brachionus plicatilis TaxID=10195 RepID=A0A3M7T7Z9_BRAPC|nr:GCN5 family acetyltransferase [Brachionus plicatilis]
MNIREESQLDYDQIDKVHDAAFNSQFESKLVRQLRQNEDFECRLSIIAENTNEQNQIVGHILFFPIRVSSNKKIIKSLALAPLGVLPSFQKKGIGSKLILEGLKAAKCLGYQSVFVLGHYEYYTRFGFKPTLEAWNIKSPFECPPENFMALELPAHFNCLKDTESVKIIYPDEFL